MKRFVVGFNIGPLSVSPESTEEELKGSDVWECEADQC